MGVPGLARRLEPYATNPSQHELKGYFAIVDGPALAFHAHKLALDIVANQARLPTYSDIIREAIIWLNSLENVDIKVSIILFDGALPHSKRAERLSRLEQNTRGIQQLRASYPTAACPIPTYLGSKSYAFLAPALREALAESGFASKTHMVPGEADDSCASYAKDLARSIIFTSDTDLVLYEYGPETLVVFFQNASPAAGFRTYSPFQIRQKIGVESLVTFAFALRQDPSDTVVDLVRKAQDLDLESDAYLDFSKRYIAETTLPAYLSHTLVSPLALQALDARVSEFVHQALADCLTPLVYLPLLVEDPNQASAFNTGQDIRILAYSLLLPHNSIVHEYRRKAQGISREEMHIYSASNMQIPAAELEHKMSMLLTWVKLKADGAEIMWLLFAISLTLAEMDTPPSINLVQRVINGGPFDNTWAFIHLTARLQAALYSLRMLKQIIKVWLATNEQCGNKLHPTLTSLDAHMASFATIDVLFTVPGQQKRVLAGHEALKPLLEETYASAGVEIPMEQVSNKKTKKRMKRANRKSKRAKQATQSRTSTSNSFEVLGD